MVSRRVDAPQKWESTWGAAAHPCFRRQRRRGVHRIYAAAEADAGASRPGYGRVPLSVLGEPGEQPPARPRADGCVPPPRLGRARQRASSPVRDWSRLADRASRVCRHVSQRPLHARLGKALGGASARGVELLRQRAHLTLQVGDRLPQTAFVGVASLEQFPHRRPVQPVRPLPERDPPQVDGDPATAAVAQLARLDPAAVDPFAAGVAGDGVGDALRPNAFGGGCKQAERPMDSGAALQAAQLAVGRLAHEDCAAAVVYIDDDLAVALEDGGVGATELARRRTTGCSLGPLDWPRVDPPRRRAIRVGAGAAAAFPHLTRPSPGARPAEGRGARGSPRAAGRSGARAREREPLRRRSCRR